jgi:hypothetical protein
MVEGEMMGKLRTFPKALGAFALLAFGLVSSARSQIRPTIIDSGEVKVTRTTTSNLDRRNLGPLRAAHAANSVLFILTDPSDARVRINGADQGKATDGKFKQEYPIGKKVEIEVSAGPDYEAFKKTLILKNAAPEIVEAALTYRYGIVRIFPAMDGVKLTMDGQPIAPETVSIDKENRQIIVDKVQPGDHQITYDLPGYVLYPRTFKISPGTEATWNLIPEKAVTSLAVATDPETAVYIDGAEKGRTPADGTLSVPGINLGQHSIKLVKDGFDEYAQTASFEFQKPVSLAHKMVPISTSAGFSDDFDVPNPARWDMPTSGLTIKSGRMYIEKAPALGFPKNIVYRDFVMNFDLRLGNGGGAAWAARVKDPNDYYLFYLSGPDGLFPNRFVTYIVKDGKFDPNVFESSVFVPVQLKAGDEYTINLTATGSSIVQTITSAKDGKSINLGAFKDPNNVFTYGDIGFRTVGKESFSIDDLFVEPH